jgi:hypothetical protein
MALLLAWCPHTPVWMSFKISYPSWGVTHRCKMPVILFLYNFPCNTTKALDRRIILFTCTVSSGSVLFTMYAKYGCIQVSSIIMTSSGSDVPLLSAPEPTAWCWTCSPVVETLLFFIDLSMISSQKTPYGTGKHWDPIFAKLSASSMLALLTCETSHLSNVPSR